MLDKASAPAEHRAANVTLPRGKSIIVLHDFGYGSAFFS